jgi:hypothetical protein
MYQKPGDSMDSEEQEIEENENEVQECTIQPALPNEIILHCRIILIRNGMASIVLTDQKGHSSFAECKVTRLKVCGISTNAGKFDIIITKSDEVEVTLRTTRKERRLSRSEWQFMIETIEQVLSDNKLCKGFPGYLI